LFHEWWEKQIPISINNITLEIIEEFHGGKLIYEDWRSLRDHIYINSEERKSEGRIALGDRYSIFKCCGDFQLAPKHIWETIKGFEEELIYCLYTDTNVQKKAVKHGFGLKAIYHPPMFHIDHGSKGWGGGGTADGIRKMKNSIHRAIDTKELTSNSDNWGFNDMNIECEKI